MGDRRVPAVADSRFLQSFKTVAASATFERALIFNRPFRFEELERLFLKRLGAGAGGALDVPPRRVIVGRPVEYAGARPDPALARRRHELMFEGFGVGVRAVHEPIGTAYSYAARLTEPATVMVADFGGGIEGSGVVIEADVDRADFERWISDDLAPHRGDDGRGAGEGRARGGDDRPGVPDRGDRR